MIEWEDIYKVVSAMVPLYVALMLGYGSVRWWKVFTAEQCDGINRFVCYFILPLFSFEFTARHANLYNMNYLVIAADALSKLIIAVVVGALFFIWPWGSRKCCSSRVRAVLVDFNWSITGFSLCTLTNLLIVGLPTLKSMYGQLGVDLIVQLTVVQTTIWMPVLLLFLEFRKLGMDRHASLTEEEEEEEDGKTDEAASADNPNKLEDVESSAKAELEEVSRRREMRGGRPSLWELSKVMGIKLVINPNIYACVIGVLWAIMAHWFKFKMPDIIEGCVLILSRAGTGTAMFNIGIFIAMQKKVIGCGMWKTMIAMLLRFIVGPAVMVVASLSVGLRGNVLAIAIIQAALPQSIATFIFAKEYGLHADVLSTAVVFGTLVSLPVLIAYYSVLHIIIT